MWISRSLVTRWPLSGYPEQMKVARAAIDMLIEGVPHENVFAFLDKKKKEAKQDMISYYYL